MERSIDWGSFAVEGHSFSFMTGGAVAMGRTDVPRPHRAGPLSRHQRRAAARGGTTATNARLAEEEWRKETRKYQVHAFSATPGLNVVPSLNGLEAHLRDIVRAFERHDTRRNLYQAVLEVLHGKWE